MSNEKLFVIVRRDLTPSQQAVQAGHALANYLYAFSYLWNYETLIYLGIKNEEELEKWKYKLMLKSIPYACFVEPDMNDEVTAIATALNSQYDESFFKNLQVL